MASYGSKSNSSTISPPISNKAEAEGGKRRTVKTKAVGKNLKVPQKDLLVFFRQLAVILQSGVPLAQGLTLIAENMTNQNLSSCVQQIAARLSAG